MRRDVIRFLLFLTVTLVIGLLLDQVLGAGLLGLALYTLWLQRNVYQLLRWIRNKKQNPAPDFSGAFENLCREIDYLRKRYKQRKKKLSGFLKQFHEATSALPDAVVILGPDDDILWANHFAENFLGIRWPQDYQRRITNLFRHPDFIAYMAEPEQEKASVEIPSPRQSNVYLELKVIPYGKKRRLFLARDVTRLHRLNQIRSDFVANVSHELRTPLTVIRGYLETLNDPDLQTQRALQASLPQLITHTQRMQAIIDDLLLLSKLEQTDCVDAPDTVIVPEMLSAILKDAKDLSGDKRHIFELSADRALWLRGSQTELYSAFSNLVTNAVRYTPDGGIIRIRWYEDDAGAHMEVSDTGIGIDAQDLPRISERFYRADRSRSRDSGGTGLGLSIVKHVLSRHRAKLHIESVLGEGSTFRCDFPEEVMQHEAPARDKTQLAESG